MRLLSVLAILVAACGHEELDFDLPDGGGSNSQHSAGSSTQVRCSGSASSCRESMNAAEDDQGSRDVTGGDASAASSGAAAAGTGGNNAPDQGVGQAKPYQDDPHGYPTGPGQLAASCAHGQSFAEVCGNDIDEDCDGTVDEYPGIGAPCRSGCGEGIYVCSTSSYALLCQGCNHELPAPCGDGFHGSDEECDPNAPFEEAGVTCTQTCERPLFIRCVDAGFAHPERCDELHVCNERIGACMPVVGPRQPRCPQLRIEGNSSGDQFYPMLETEGGECWVTCSESQQCPSSLSECYMGFCAVPF
jgi:hypothetical protein